MGTTELDNPVKKGSNINFSASYCKWRLYITRKKQLKKMGKEVGGRKSVQRPSICSSSTPPAYKEPQLARRASSPI